MLHADILFLAQIFDAHKQCKMSGHSIVIKLQMMNAEEGGPMGSPGNQQLFMN